jgi:NitT/TauT family transport system ATP-binding protein
MNPVLSAESTDPIVRDDPVAVSIRGVSKSYREVEALRNIDLDIPRGKLTSLLGPSGCGKTTLLKIMGGLLQPDKGEIRVEGQVVTRPGPDRAFVFQDFALLPWASVLRNAAFGLELRGIDKEKRNPLAGRYVSQVGLEGFEHKYPHQLSGGMKQRVGLARALVVNADVLLLDEPFSAVDEQNRRKFQEDLMQLREVERKTFVFVTHSIEEAVYVSDRIVLLSPRPGRISQIIEPAIDRTKSPDAIRRDQHYLDTVEIIWNGLRQYAE